MGNCLARNVVVRSGNMLSKPEYGWSNITIRDWSDRCSYIDDIPVMLLDAIYQQLCNNTIQAVGFDAEGYEYIIIFDKFYTHIITYKDNITYKTIEIDIETIAKELVDDIQADLELWISWSYKSLSKTQEKRRKMILNDFCYQIRELIGMQ